MQSMFPETSPHKIGRRVLGEKTVNASLTPVTKRIIDAKSQKSSAIKAIPFNAASNEVQTKTRETSPEIRHAGQKRTIDQVVPDINEAESEPRKVFMSSQSEVEGEFKIFDDANGTVTCQREETLEMPSQQRDEGNIQKSLQLSEERLEKEEQVSRVPTEPAARKLFIQQTAALAKSRFQSAMRRVETKSLDRVLSQYEANNRPFLRSTSSLSSSSSTPSIQREQQDGQSSQKTSPTKEKRILLPPLPLQPRSRPVRSAQMTVSSPSSESRSGLVNVPRNEGDKEEGFDINEDDDDFEKTPKQSDIGPQNNIMDVRDVDVGMSMSQYSDSAMDKLIKWTQSSTESNRTVEA